MCRELTKKHETAFVTTISEALKWYGEHEPKGECVLVIEGKNRKEMEEEAQKKWEDAVRGTFRTLYATGKRQKRSNEKGGKRQRNQQT